MASDFTRTDVVAEWGRRDLSSTVTVCSRAAPSPRLRPRAARRRSAAGSRSRSRRGERREDAVETGASRRLASFLVVRGSRESGVGLTAVTLRDGGDQRRDRLGGLVGAFERCRGRRHAAGVVAAEGCAGAGTRRRVRRRDRRTCRGEGEENSDQGQGASHAHVRRGSHAASFCVQTGSNTPGRVATFG